MKARLAIVFLIILGIALASTWGVSAQGPQPTPPEPRPLIQPPLPEPPLQPGPPSSFALDSQDHRFQAPLALAPSGPSSPSALGQPGLSFRYLQSFGTVELAYPTPDNYHLNAPSGLFIDAGNNLYVVEDRGYRVLRYGPDLTNTLALGVAGLCVMRNNPQGFCVPQDLALDKSGNLWVADGGNRVVQLSSAGAFLQQMPLDTTWYTGNDNTHFGLVTGIAFDNVAGRMFVADGTNHRVQVYTFSGALPVYSATIGVTGESAKDATHLNYPRRLAVDSTGQLYIVDTNNDRVQRCSFGESWTCSTFGSGLNKPQGIGLDSTDNVYIADSNNSRVVKCDPAGTCSNLITGLSGWASDVAVDSGGNVFVSDWVRAVVVKYDSSGAATGTKLGTLNVPYTADNTPNTPLLNSPWGIGVANDGSMYVVERNGNRLLKLNAAGVRQWSFGKAGVPGEDQNSLNDPQGSIAVDGSGRIYVPDTNNNRIQIFRSDGTYDSSFGSSGTGNKEFSCPSGVTINRANGDIYVVDRCNQRILIYYSNWYYKATLGTTLEAGTDNAHFDTPRAVAVDASGRVYVADGNNHRVQKCTVSGTGGTCSTLIGETGVMERDFGHLNIPVGVAVDSAGRLYVADQGNMRVQVFTLDGAYLTTLGGAWGSGTSQMRSPAGLAFDSTGNLYVTDRVDNRIQKFAVGVPDWTQKNLNGFGDRNNVRASALAAFNGQLYAGTHNIGGDGAQLWRLGGDGNWASVITPGFGITRNVGIDSLFVFKGNLYAGTWNQDLNTGATQGGQVWRSADGTTWSPVALPGSDATNLEIIRFTAFNDQIYASTWSYTTTHGSEIWRSPSGDSGTWTRVTQTPHGFGNANNVAIISFETFNGYLYAGTRNEVGGSQVWRTLDGVSWTPVSQNGFGAAESVSVSALAVFNGYLYAGAYGPWAGSEIWRCSLCNGSDWAKVVSGGFGNSNNRGEVALEKVPGYLFASTTNLVTGMDVWKSSTGNAGDWKQAASAGFGDSNNMNGYFDNAFTFFNEHLYTGTRNPAHGGEVWQLNTSFTPPPVFNLYLPALLR